MKKAFSFGLFFPHYWGKIHLSTINYEFFYSVWWEKEQFLALVNACSYFFFYFWVIFPPRLSSFPNMHAVVNTQLETWGPLADTQFFLSVQLFLLHYSVLYTMLQAPSPKPRETSDLYVDFLSFGQAYNLSSGKNLWQLLASIFWFQQKGNFCLTCQEAEVSTFFFPFKITF